MIKKLFGNVVKDEKIDILCFEDFLNDVNDRPKIHLRNSSLYIKEVFDYYGKNKDGYFKLFLLEDDDYHKVYGNKKIQRLIYNSISNFIEQGFNNKFLLLAGPNGSAKTTLIKKLMNACEKYSLTDEGSLYTFSWIFPVSKKTSLTGTSQLGLNPNKTERIEEESYAHLKDNDIAAVVNSELKDNPILLLPKEIRQKYIEELFKSDPNYLKKIKKTYLYKGDLSKRNKDIYEALLKDYNGSHEEVLKHVRVERYNISKRYSSSAVTIEPQMHVDAKVQQITMDRRIQNLPPSIQSLNLFQSSGELVSANRGVLEYSDLLKRPLDAYKYLLMTIENKTINIQGLLVELDILFMGSSNEIHYSQFKQHPDYKSFKARFKVIHVPYLTDFKEEKKIYEDHLKEVKNNKKFQPNSLEAFSMWNVMTRLHEPNKVENTKYSEETKKVFDKINSLDKALIYAEKFSDLDSQKYSEEERKILKNKSQKLKREWASDDVYEGRFGMSPRESKELLFELIHSNKMISYVEVLDYLANLEKKNIYGELEAQFVEKLEANQNNDSSFKSNKKRIELLKTHYDKMFDNELRDSLGLVDNLAYESYIKRYVDAINAELKNEKMYNKITQKYENVDQNFLKEFEDKIGLNVTPKEFRSSILNKVGVYSLDNPNKKIIYSEIFKESIYKKLKENFIDSQKNKINEICSALDYFSLEESENNAEKDISKFINDVLDNLNKKYGYDRKVALYLIRNNYCA